MAIRTERALYRERWAPSRTGWTKLIPAGALAALDVNGGRRAKVEGDVAALFVDIEGCTRLCEDLPAREMAEVIETYFGAYLDVVHASSGEITELLGDGLVTFFEGSGARQSARAALRAALGIRAATHRLNRRRHGGHDAITVNMGLNAGRALVGITRLRGRAGERWFYTAAGPVTNVAARLCALARHGQILTTRATSDLLPPGCACRPLGPQSLKNVANPVEVIEIRSDGCTT